MMRKLFASALLVFFSLLSGCFYKKKTVPDRKDLVPSPFFRTAVEEIRTMDKGERNRGRDLSESLCKEKLIVLMDELQAKYADIPFHFDFIPVLHKCVQDVESIQLWYEAELDSAVVALFYRNEMERLGWKEEVIFDGCDEIVLIFKKPERLCVVSVRCRESGYFINRKKMVDVVFYVEKESC